MELPVTAIFLPLRSSAGSVWAAVQWAELGNWSHWKITVWKTRLLISRVGSQSVLKALHLWLTTEGLEVDKLWPWHHPLCLSDSDRKHVGICKATKTQGAHSSGRDLQTEIQKVLLTGSLAPMKGLFHQIICPHCPHFTVHIFIFSLHVFYRYPMGPSNFCNIPHARIFFTKWQPDPHDSFSEIILSYKAPTSTKFQPSPNNQPRCWVPLVSGCFSHTCGN